MKLYEKIIAGKVKYPSYFESPAKDLLRSVRCLSASSLPSSLFPISSICLL